MTWNNKVIWTEGMFLQPLHFQQQDRNTQHWVESRCGSLQSFAWGVTHLEIDPQLLSLGKFAIIACRGVFPDGTPFSIPEQHPAPRPLELAESTSNEIIYLALPIQRQAGKEITWEDADDELSRYRLQEIEIRDMHSQSDSGASVIQSGELWTRLRPASKNQGAFVTIPLAKVVERKKDKQLVLDKDFIASSLQCSGASKLLSYIKEISGILQHRGEALAQRLATPGAGGVAEITDFLLLQIINRYQPLFHHFTAMEQFHPERLFSVIIQMAGELATITQEGHRAGEFPDYQHNNLQLSFEPVMLVLRQSLSWVSESRAVSIPLKEHANQVHTADINDRELLNSAVFVLAASAQMDADLVRQYIPRKTIISTVDKLRDLVMSQVPGIKLNSMAVAPRQIPFHKGMVYFELDKNHSLWKELQQSGTIAFHFSGEYPELKLEFWAIRS
ncbi:MAG: type VI secretion system baseplate subunit TssK [Methyloprofundus sp.]|nr:type VI secretion system baseplate subunit TssK [Methyloprofundus sp.]